MSTQGKNEKTPSNEQENSAVSGEPSTELTAVVDDLLNSLSTKFASVSSEIFEKIEAMSKRLDQMETQLQQTGSTIVPK
ncbi:heat shock factor binding protein 1 [Tuber brumale]|nr:heat shock factor binding protein 1 [Tuber brumale]